MNRFFIVDSDDVNLTDIYDCCIEDGATVRTSLDGTKLVVKLAKGDEDTHSCLSGYTEYDHTGIRLEMSKVEWQDGEI